MSYSRAEIEAYVEKNLHIAGDIGKSEAQARRELADTIERLPHSQRTMIIENQTAIIMASPGKYESIAREIEVSKSLSGADSHGTAYLADMPAPTLSQQFNRSASGVLKTPLLIKSTEDMDRTLHHELGHNFDSISGDKAWLSEGNDKWKSAVDREIAMRSNTPHEPLYPGHVSLEEHLSRYEPELRHLEAKAEMSALYTKLNEIHSGDKARVEQILSERHPEMWPAYRDELMPKIDTKANELLEKRTTNIDRYVQQSRELSEAKGIPFNEQTVRTQAGLSSAQGNIEDDTKKLTKEILLHKDPLANYLNAREQAERAEWNKNNGSVSRLRESLRTGKSAGKSEPFVFDREGAKADAERIMQQGGKEALIDSIKAIEEKRVAAPHTTTPHVTTPRNELTLAQKLGRRAGAVAGAVIGAGVGGYALYGGASPAEAALAAGKASVPGVAGESAKRQGRMMEAAISDSEIFLPFSGEVTRPIARAFGADVDPSLLQELKSHMGKPVPKTEFDEIYEKIPTETKDSMSPEMKALVERKRMIVEAEQKLAEVNNSVGGLGSNLLVRRDAATRQLHDMQDKFAETYKELETCGGLETVRREVGQPTPRELVAQEPQIAVNIPQPRPTTTPQQTPVM